MLRYYTPAHIDIDVLKMNFHAGGKIEVLISRTTCGANNTYVYIFLIISVIIMCKSYIVFIYLLTRQNVTLI